MTYIDRINALNQWEGVSGLSSNAFRLYHALLYNFNAAFWPVVLHVSNKRLMEYMGTGSDHTVINARNELIAASLIVCEQGAKGKEYRYTLAELPEGTAKSAIGIAENAEGTAKSATFIDNILSLNNIPSNNLINNKPVYHKYGEYEWIKLTDIQYEKLLKDLGQAELDRCIAYIDELAQSTGNKNKWKDWNLVIRRCHRENWGYKKGQEPVSPSIWEPLPDLIPDYTTQEGDLL